MDNAELQNIWNAYDQRLERILAINKDIAIELLRKKLKNQINRLSRPKWVAIFIGMPYTLLLMAISILAFISEAYIVAFGFGVISTIMIVLLGSYFYQLYLIHQVKNNEVVLSTQRQLSKLRISSFRSLSYAIFQLPFWSVCWISVDGLNENPLRYGGVNLLIFILLTCLAFWLYHKVSFKNKDSKIRNFFFSGREWEPILKSAEILEQIKEYEK